jgi:hypothetical protein
LIRENSRYGYPGWRRRWRCICLDEEVMNTNTIIAVVEFAVAAYVGYMIAGKVKAR